MTFVKGRGAGSNHESKYLAASRNIEDDGWIGDTVDEESCSGPKTIITPHRARSTISRNASPDIEFEQSVNPYLAVSMAAFAAMHGQVTPISAFRLALTLKQRSSLKRMHHMS
ncbi:hypothetical protein [Paucibacter sp. KCTC 42545]|uniref:hypothetical protein n=1 Tax=Paucibacter sp. KCTC 42545 TaxID=1768242 RepID=UPI000733B1A4|nr:hypothetical protein [Paucibacter sp. KCTC 42545]ALT77839.1 hypothetical protein AT984_12260 [Paucibacter sp. KCTC 42545]